MSSKDDQLQDNVHSAKRTCYWSLSVITCSIFIAFAAVVAACCCGYGSKNSCVNAEKVAALEKIVEALQTKVKALGKGGTFSNSIRLININARSYI